jgi:long-chain fatty acid transport protein
MRKISTLTFILSFLWITSNLFGNGLNLNSIGPKALGMGGAYMGLSDDYTAVCWNPAGIIQIVDPQLSIFVTDIYPAPTYKVTELKIDTKAKSNHYISPNFGGFLPLMKSNLTLGLGIYVPSGIGDEWKGEDLKLLSKKFNKPQYEWMGKIGVFYFAPVIAYKINDMLSVGAALNISYGMFDMKRPMGDFMTEGQYDESSTGMGFGATFGILAKPLDILSVGISVKTENKIKFSGTAKYSTFQTMDSTHGKSDFDRDLAWPLTLGFGLALKPIEKFTFCFDLQWYQWSKTEDVISMDYKDSLWNILINNTGQNKINMKWKDCMQIRFGAQYEMSDVLTLRVGFYTDPAPAPDETLNIIFPSISYVAPTAGFTYKFCNNMAMDFGVEYIMGTERTIPLNATYQKDHPDAMPGNHNNNILAASIGFSYFFK